jgi:hypothetical protein
MSSATCGERKRDSSVRLPLHGVEQPRVRDRDGRLVREGFDKLDLPLGERPRKVPADADDTDQLVIQEDRDAEQRSVADDGLRPERVIGVGEDVGDLYRLTGQRRASHDGRPVTQVRMFLRIVVALSHVGDLRSDQEDVALGEVELTVLAVAQAGRRLDDRVEHGLEALRTRDRAEDLIQRLTLLAQVLVLPDELFDVERLVASHPLDSSATVGASRGARTPMDRSGSGRAAISEVRIEGR